MVEVFGLETFGGRDVRVGLLPVEPTESYCRRFVVAAG